MGKRITQNFGFGESRKRDAGGGSRTAGNQMGLTVPFPTTLNVAKPARFRPATQRARRQPDADLGRLIFFFLFLLSLIVLWTVLLESSITSGINARIVPTIEAQ